MKLKVAVKGGPKSGNFGHSGRPGIGVGGSSPAKYRAGKATLDWLKSHDAFKYPYPQDIISKVNFNEDKMQWSLMVPDANTAPYYKKAHEQVLGWLAEDKFPIRHLIDLRQMFVGFPKKENDNVYGEYAHNIIGLNTQSPNMIHTFAHELGHHLYNVHELASTVASAYETLADNVRHKLENTYPAISWSTIDGHSVHDIANNMPTIATHIARVFGLRPYSLTEGTELIADTYKVWKFGHDEQKVALARLFKVNDLRALFP